MSVLYIYGGDSDKILPIEDSTRVFSYYLGNGQIEGRGIKNINDANRLNSIAAESAEKFSDFIFQENQSFIQEDLIFEKDLSLYFLSDFACKRSEISPTFGNYCNSVLLNEFSLTEQVSKIVFDQCKPGLTQAVSSKINHVEIKVINPPKRHFSLVKILTKNCQFYVKIITIGIISLFFKKPKNFRITSKEEFEIFLTRFPLHLSENLVEDKFGAMIRDHHSYLVHLLTDDFHQKLSVKKYFHSFSFLSASDRVYILDAYMQLMDIVKNIFLNIGLMPKFLRVVKKKFIFDGTNLSFDIHQEILFSMMRIPRLLLWRNAVKRFLSQHRISNFHYYLHEYTYGRFFTYIIKKYSPTTKRVGFQHGPVSATKLVCMAGNKELSAQGDGVTSFPVPDKVLAEDPYSEKIYRKSGYRNVLVMPKIYRLEYLSKIIRRPEKETYLIAAGLHDGEFLIKSLLDEIDGTPDARFIFKTHPRANNKYVVNLPNLENFILSNESIEKILSRVTRVYVTYSSVAIEAKMLGIDVRIVDLPGRINESPLIDSEFCDRLVPVGF